MISCLSFNHFLLRYAIRIIVLNNYPLERVWRNVQRGNDPDHHLYGINYFAHRGHEVEIVPFRTSPLLQTINVALAKGRFPIPLGDLDQQWSLLRHLHKGDVIYSPCQTQTQLLSYLRALGVLKTPIVCLAHHPLERGCLQWVRRPFNRLFIKGNDVFPALSQRLANMINSLSGEPNKSLPLCWGPDANFYPAAPVSGRGVVAAGRTGRDFETFGRAATLAESPAHIICLHSDWRQSFSEFGENVQVTAVPDKNYMSYAQLLPIFAQARVMAIPLSQGDSLAGLTSLTDALGMGKPVIMTRHPLIDLDIEAEGIGKWVEVGDVQGWHRAIRFFDEQPDLSLEMGRRARNLVEDGWNSVAFAEQILDILEGVANCKMAPPHGEHN